MGASKTIVHNPRDYAVGFIHGCRRRTPPRMTVSTPDRQRPRRAATPHTAVMRRRAALVRRGRRLLRTTEDLLGTEEHSAFEDPGHLNVLVAQLDVLNAEVTERLSSGRVDEDGP